MKDMESVQLFLIVTGMESVQLNQTFFFLVFVPSCSPTQVRLVMQLETKRWQIIFETPPLISC